MGFGSYLLLWLLLTCVLGRPLLYGGVLLLVALLQRFLPRPTALLNALRHARRLRAEIAVNPANVRAHRDLARIYLDVMRPRAAAKLLEAALARAPKDAELLYLSGLALTRSGRHEAALPRLVEAVELDARIAFGQPFLAAGEALYALKRWDGAIDAYERYLSSNSADVAAHTRLARAHYRAGERDAARKVLEEASLAFRGLQGRQRVRALRGFFKLQWTRVWMLRDPRPALIALVPLVAVVLLGRACVSQLERAPDGLGEMAVSWFAGDLIEEMQAMTIPVVAPLDTKAAAAAKAEFVVMPGAYAAGTSHKFARVAIPSDASDLESLNETWGSNERSQGEFLGRLCSLFGPPRGDFPSLDYTLLHTKTGVVFTAYAADGAPAYGGAHHYQGPMPPPPEPSGRLSPFTDDAQLRTVVMRFEALLMSQPLADCSVVQDTDFGLYRYGARAGKTIDAPLSFAEAIDFYTAVIDKYGPQSDAAVYYLAFPERELLGRWVEATPDERAQRPAALEHARSGWRSIMKELEASAAKRPVDPSTWSVTWSHLNSSAPTLELPAEELERLVRLREPPAGP